MSDIGEKISSFLNNPLLKQEAARNFIVAFLGFGLLVGLVVGVVFSSLLVEPEKVVEKVIVEVPVEVRVEVPVPVPTPVPTPPKVETPPEPPKPETPPKPPKEAIKLTKMSYDQLPGWQNDDLAGVEIALAKSCAKINARPAEKTMGRGHDAIPMTYADWQGVCQKFAAQPDLSGENLRAFIMAELTPYLAANNDKKEGKFTGYFEAELRGSRTKDATYKYPLFAKPKDLVSVNLGQFSDELKGRHVIGRVNADQKFIPYHERETIEAGGLESQSLEILWIDDAVDVFLLQVQGSGRVILPDGSVARVGYAAHNGHKYQSIGRYLIEQGEIEKHKASWGGIRNWLEKNPDKQAALFAQNPRFVFFRELGEDGPIGSQGAALTPMRSLAVDQRYVPLGSLVWLDTVQPGGSTDPLQTLMVAQDTGGAIKGPVRGDFFWGYGEKALAKAGRMNSKGTYYVLVPNSTAARLGE